VILQIQVIINSNKQANLEISSATKADEEIDSFSKKYNLKKEQTEKLKEEIKKQLN
jgi:hypothetical protein